MTIREIITELEHLAPPPYQESYDNAKLITGDGDWDCKGAVICLDAIEDVLDEAISRNYNLVIAHHPIVFTGLRSITGKDYVERVVIKAIKNDIAIYAIHTNLDNVVHGVNQKIAEKLQLTNIRILAPKQGILRKLYSYVPVDHAENVLNALFDAGGGQIGKYSECSFTTKGLGTFKAGEGADPFVGEKGERHSEEEVKVEVIFSIDRQADVLNALKEAHPYEEIAYEIVALENDHPLVGSGMIGTLSEEMDTTDFLHIVKSTMKSGCIRHSRLVKKNVRTIAICGGAGSFLLPHAIRAGADIFITGDYKYHQFFDADGKIVIADIGHFESEQYTGELIYEVLSQKFGNFAVHLSKVNTNPINYL